MDERFAWRMFSDVYFAKKEVNFFCNETVFKIRPIFTTEQRLAIETGVEYILYKALEHIYSISYCKTLDARVNVEYLTGEKFNYTVNFP
jgi:hypothetical protein